MNESHTTCQDRAYHKLSIDLHISWFILCTNRLFLIVMKLHTTSMIKIGRFCHDLTWKPWSKTGNIICVDEVGWRLWNDAVVATGTDQMAISRAFRRGRHKILELSEHKDMISIAHTHSKQHMAWTWLLFCLGIELNWILYWKGSLSHLVTATPQGKNRHH